jgi:putative phosphoesterase
MGMKAKIVIIADTHIPERASDVPQGIKEVLLNEVKDADILVHGGDLVSEDVLRWTKSLAPKVYIVRGNMDYLDLPEKEKFSIGTIRIGVVHGHQVYPRGNLDQLTDIAKRMNVDILISAHTHRPLVKKYGGILHLNPGSLTGVWGGGGGSMKPSFIVMRIEENKVDVNLYELEKGAVKKYFYEHILS